MDPFYYCVQIQNTNTPPKPILGPAISQSPNVKPGPNKQSPTSLWNNKTGWLVLTRSHLLLPQNSTSCYTTTSPPPYLLSTSNPSLSLPKQNPLHWFTSEEDMWNPYHLPQPLQLPPPPLPPWHHHTPYSILIPHSKTNKCN